MRLCAAEDPTFLRRLVALNPNYLGCCTADMVATQAAQIVERNAEHHRERYFGMPAAVRCFALLLWPPPDE